MNPRCVVLRSGSGITSLHLCHGSVPVPQCRLVRVDRNDFRAAVLGDVIETEVPAIGEDTPPGIPQSLLRLRAGGEVDAAVVLVVGVLLAAVAVAPCLPAPAGPLAHLGGALGVFLVDVLGHLLGAGARVVVDLVLVFFAAWVLGVPAGSLHLCDHAALSSF